MILCMKCGHKNRDGNLFCTQCGTRLAESERASAKLIVMSPPEESQEYPLFPSSLYIGRGSSNAVVVEDGLVSNRHARLFYDEGGFCVEDLESTNGTYVNGRRIEDKVRLKDEDLIKVGTVILKFISS